MALCVGRCGGRLFPRDLAPRHGVNATDEEATRIRGTPGRETVRVGVELLSHAAVCREPHRITRPDVLAQERLSAMLTMIQEDQSARDEDLLASPKINRRRKQQIRAAREPADAPLEV